MPRSTKRAPYTLTDLMADDRVSNSWVASACLDFYVRKGRTWTRLGNASYIRPCLMVANFNVRRRTRVGSRRLAGQMVTFMREVETTALRFGYAGVFVECVYNTKLHPLLQRSGYRRTNPDSLSPCFFKPASSIRDSIRHAPLGIQELQRPSLRRFLHTPDIPKFWLHEQNENVIMFVSRARIGSAPALSWSRFTIINVYRYKVDSEDTAHTLYWCEDETLLVKLMQKLESRIVSAGFQELAIHPDVINTMIKTGYGRTSEGSAPELAKDRMRQLGYDISSDESNLLLYVKRLSTT